MMKWVSVVLMVMLAFVFSCAPKVIEGRKIDSEKLKQMNVGQSSKAKVEELFGKPSRVETVSAGVERFIYTYRTVDPEWYTIDKTQKQDFEVWFRNGILQYYKLHTEGQEVVLKE